MPMLRICSVDGCETKTLGNLCLNHETVSRHTAKPPAGQWAEPAQPKAA